MPIKTVIYTGRNLTIHIASGDLTFSEIAETLSSYYENPEMPEQVIWDGRNASLRHFSSLQLEEIASYPTRFNVEKTKIKGGLRAIVAPTDLDYGLSRVIQIVTGLAGDELPYKVQVFRTMEEAIRWIEEETAVMKIRKQHKTVIVG